MCDHRDGPLLWRARSVPHFLRERGRGGKRQRCRHQRGAAPKMERLDHRLVSSVFEVDDAEEVAAIEVVNASAALITGAWEKERAAVAQVGYVRHRTCHRM